MLQQLVNVMSLSQIFFWLVRILPGTAWMPVSEDLLLMTYLQTYPSVLGLGLKRNIANAVREGDHF